MRVPSTASLLLGFLALALAGPVKAQNSFLETDLVSDLGGRAAHQDSGLVNPWGILVGPGGRVFVADNGSSLLTTYGLMGDRLGPAVTIPPMGGGAPTGMVLSPGFARDFDGRFDMGPAGGGDGDSSSMGGMHGMGGGPAFVFATENGTLVRWRPGRDSTLAQVVESDSNSVFKGIALGSGLMGPVYFVTDFRNARIEVFDAMFHPLDWGAGAFRDSTIPDGYAPFGIAHLGDRLIVTYAKQDDAKHDDVKGAGFGFVDAYDLHGHLLRRLVSNGPLNAPWGIVRAPGGFGDFGGDLLIGNFGDGTINAFDAMDGHSLGALQDTSGHPITIDGLWGLAFGSAGPAFGRRGDAAPSAGAGDDDHVGHGARLFFAAGLNGENDGLMGTIALAAPDTAHLALRWPGRGAALRVTVQGVNPVRLASTSAVAFRLESAGGAPVTLGIYDAAGRLVAQPARALPVAGDGAVTWDGRNLDGVRVPTGTYFYRATDGASVATGRLVIVR